MIELWKLVYVSLLSSFLISASTCSLIWSFQPILSYFSYSINSFSFPFLSHSTVVILYVQGPYPFLSSIHPNIPPSLPPSFSHTLIPNLPPNIWSLYFQWMFSKIFFVLMSRANARNVSQHTLNNYGVQHIHINLFTLIQFYVLPLRQCRPKLQ